MHGPINIRLYSPVVCTISHYITCGNICNLLVKERGSLRVFWHWRLFQSSSVQFSGVTEALFYYLHINGLYFVKYLLYSVCFKSCVLDFDIRALPIKATRIVALCLANYFLSSIQTKVSFSSVARLSSKIFQNAGFTDNAQCRLFHSKLLLYSRSHNRAVFVETWSFLT